MNIRPPTLATTFLLLTATWTWAASTPAAQSGSSAPAPARILVLTEGSLTRSELPTGRQLASVSLPPSGAARKVVHRPSVVFLQRKRSVEILEDKTLRRAGVVELQDEIKDIAADGDLLAVATGPEERSGRSGSSEGVIHVFRMGKDGSAKAVTALRVPKPVHGLIMQGPSLYAIDDVVTPVYAHYVDLQQPERAQLSTISWGGVYAHFVSQTVADRWYVFGTHWSGPMNTGMTEVLLVLPLGPPLRILTKVEERYPHHIHTAPAEFRVHGGFLYWIREGADGRTWLMRRRLDQVAAESLFPMGPSIWPKPARKGTIDLIGSWLYVAADRELGVFDLSGGRPLRTVRIPTASTNISFTVEGRP